MGYEVHYVHSSAGFDKEALAEADMETADLLADGLGGAANGRGLLNPMIVVQAQVFQIESEAARLKGIIPRRLACTSFFDKDDFVLSRVQYRQAPDQFYV